MFYKNYMPYTYKRQIFWIYYPLVICYMNAYTTDMKRIARIYILTMYMLCSCSTQHNSVHTITEESPLLRPNPAYVQYVKNRSLLSQSTALLSTVASSMYSLTAQQPRSAVLRSMASVWLYINPSLYVTDIGTPFFKAIDYGNILDMLTQTGIQGLYISPLFGTSYTWTNESKMQAFNKDAVQFEIASDLGSLQDFGELRTSIGDKQMFFGTSLLPIATGMGADFWLATHSVEQYQGVYALIALPKDIWHAMPMVEATKTLPLDSGYVERLRENNIIPQHFIQDSLPYFSNTGWAITSEITDINGESQRYIYRYYQMPQLPLLHVHNPTLNTIRILNASVVQSIGIYGSALVGFSLMPYYGFTNTSDSDDTSTLYTPIAQHIERTIQQYGAFAFLEDSLPFPLLAHIAKENSAVFIEDSITSPYAEYALLTHNTELLKAMLSHALALDIPFERLVHTTLSEKGLPRHPIALYTNNQKHYVSKPIEEAHRKVLESIKALNTRYPFMTKDTLPYNSVSLAVMSLGYPLHESLQYQEKEYHTLIKAHSALLFFKAMLPGILMISAQDLIAPIPMKQVEYERTGNTWNEAIAGYGGYTLQVLPYSSLINRFTIPLVKTLYPEFQTQDLTPSSLKHTLQKILKLRSQHAIFNTTCIELLPTNSTIVALLLRNEQNIHYIAITNFTNKAQKYVLKANAIDISKKIASASVQSYPPRKIHNSTLYLQPYDCILIRIE